MILNFTVTFGNEKIYGLEKDEIDALGSGESEGSSGSYEVMKTFSCSDGNGAIQRCTYEWCYQMPSNPCNSYDEVLSCPTPSATGTGNGYTDTSLCAQQGHLWGTQTATYKICSRCQATAPIPHTHIWSLYSTTHIGNNYTYTWECACGATTTTTTNSPPSS